jgi:mycothiol synthase
MEWGPLTREDARPLAELWTAIEAEDRIEVPLDAGQMAEHLASPLIDLAAGTIAAREGDQVVAFGYLPVRQSAGEVHVMQFWGGVHPAHRRRGLGRRILGWGARTAPELSAKAFPGLPVELHLSVHDGHPGLTALAEGAGFAAVRSFARMTRSLSGDLPASRPPAGVSIVAWSPEADEDARRVRNESFRDHWGSVPHTPESWHANITGTRNFRPEGSFVALAGDRAVGVLMTHVRGERTAWIQIVGTLREWRGKGVASALIAHALAAFAAQGYDSAGLGVDAGNPTGAVAVYARAGFAVARRSATYALRLTPG